MCQALRARGVEAPVLFLTARDAMTDRLAGFGAGGDDYVTKPFHFDELVARLRALLRRAGADAAASVGGLRLDPVTHAVCWEDREAPLTPTEFRLLYALALEQGRVVSRDELLQRLWGRRQGHRDRTVDVFVRRLREKIEDDPSRPAHLQTVWGVGYRLVP